MYYDLKISNNFTDNEKLKYLKGFCISNTFDNNAEEIKEEVKEEVKGMSFFSDNINNDKENLLNSYSRIDIYENELNFNLIKKYDLVSIKTVNVSKRILKYDVDIISIDIKYADFIKRPLINVCKEYKLFLELVINDSLKDDYNKVLWLKALRKVLKYGGKSILIISSGAENISQLKTPDEIKSILKIFKIRNGDKIIKNSELCLRMAALKRFTYKNCICDDSEVKSNLKNNFIWNYFT